MDLNVVLPFLSSALSFVFFVMLVDQWRERRRPYQAAWALGMLWYALSAGTEWLGGVYGWSEPLYRAWYLIGAVWVAGWLGLGTVLLLAHTRFAYAFALSLLLAGLFTYLTQQRYDYPGSGVAPQLYGAAGVLLAGVTVVLAARRSERWTWVAVAAIVGGTLLSAVMVATVSLPAPGWVVDPRTHIPTGELFPGTIRLLTPFFNITGALALVLGALYSAYIFMPKRRRGHHPRGHQRPQPLRRYQRLLPGRAARRDVPVLRVPRLDRGVRAGARAVHKHRPMAPPCPG